MAYPVAEEGTIRILRLGDARLSPDLMIARQFTAYADKKNKTIRLKPGSHNNAGRVLNVWTPNERSKSGRISLGAVIKELGFSLDEVIGNSYSVKLNAGTIVLRFK